MRPLLALTDNIVRLLRMYRHPQIIVAMLEEQDLAHPLHCIVCGKVLAQEQGIRDGFIKVRCRTCETNHTPREVVSPQTRYLFWR